VDPPSGGRLHGEVRGETSEINDLRENYPLGGVYDFTKSVRPFVVSASRCDYIPGARP
jgi:hypothetical protein